MSWNVRRERFLHTAVCYTLLVLCASCHVLRYVQWVQLVMMYHVHSLPRACACRWVLLYLIRTFIKHPVTSPTPPQSRASRP